MYFFTESIPCFIAGNDYKRIKSWERVGCLPTQSLLAFVYAELSLLTPLLLTSRETTDPPPVTVPAPCLQATGVGRSWGGGRGRLRCGRWGRQRPLILRIFTTRPPSIYWLHSPPIRQNTFHVVANDPNVPNFGVPVNQPHAHYFG